MLTEAPAPYRARPRRMERRLTRAGKGPTLPPDREKEAILTNEWLEQQLCRPLLPNESQTFGRMCLDAWVIRYGTANRPYTMRLPENRSQRTVYLPDDVPLLLTALRRYKQSNTYKRAEAMRKAAHDG